MGEQKREWCHWCVVSLTRPSLEGRGSGDTAIVDLCSLANFFRRDKYITLRNIT